MIKKKIYLFFLLVVVSLTAKESYATHLRAGEITILREDCTSLTFIITITIFTDTGSEVRFGEGVLNFGDGNEIITPIVDNTNRTDLGLEVGLVTYKHQHTYSGPGQYIISYREPNRNEGVLNMFGSVETQFYIETVINIDPILGCNNTPQLLIPPIDKSCVGATWFHNSGAYDLDGDSLSFELITPKQNKRQFVADYLYPNDREFYETIGLDYSTSNEAKNAPPIFAIDSKTGTITWDAPGASGEYNIAFLIKEWRNIGGVWALLGYVTRDMQIIVRDCDNKRPELIAPEDICVEAGTIINEDIFGTDPDQNDVKLEVYSVVLELLFAPATYTPKPPVFQSTIGGMAKHTFTWATQCEHVKDQPYQVIFKITDRSVGGANLVAFKTWNITVIAPAPIWKEVKFASAPRAVNLEWDPYVCSNAEKMQIWRRAGTFDASPSECVMGMPDIWGFTKIAEIPIGTTLFVDNNKNEGLISGLTYCYRMVAIFPDLMGGESYVSQAQCLTVKADVPITTQITTDITDLSNGQITVAWRSPFEVDPIQFPPPYTFEVYRSESFTTDTSKQIKIHTGRLSDSTFIDNSELNTQEKVYNYQITAFDANNTEIGSSLVASSVRLNLSAQFQQIVLQWEADVPWSNKAQAYPWHRIYRGPASATENQMILIDSINVHEMSFNYTDAGQFNNTALSANQEYCYRIMTRGSYNNPKIKEPIENFSQITCAQPDDREAPCKPYFAVDLQYTPCDEYITSTPCEPSIFSNLLTWDPPSDPICREDVESYNIYISKQKGDEFVLHKQNHRDTEFKDENLPSFARCYKISAVDQAGNESELSDSICFDNCPNYQLPNVFTPNGDMCNQVFSAYSNRIVIDENGNGPCGNTGQQQIQQLCARFVEKINFTLFNRWGQPVYYYQSGGEKSIFIDWNGEDNFGNELSSGIYFYFAEVVFDVVDPSQKIKLMKGWVHLIR